MGPFYSLKLATLAGAMVATLTAAPTMAPAGMLEKPDGFPQRPITMIVPYGAGGGSDQLSRAMAKAIAEVAGVNFQVVNKPGGGGTAAIPDFMLAPADGYTVMEHIDNAVSAYAKGDIRENPGEDWVPLCMAQITFSQLYIRPDEERFSDWTSFLAYAKANPGDIAVANVGKVGSMEVINMQKLEEALGFKTKLISFDKPSERYASLIGGHVDILFEQPGDVSSFLANGSMKPILTFFDSRPGDFADVPTHKDAGADFEALLRFRGFYVKKGVPGERIDYLAAACKEGFGTASFQDFNKNKFMHLIDSYRDSQGAVELIAGAVTTYQDVYKAQGLIK